MMPFGLGPFAFSGALFDNPRGGIENVEEQKAAIRWAALNIGDHEASEWVEYRDRALVRDVLTFPWRRCRQVSDVIALCTVGKAWGSPTIGVNLEDEALGSLPPELVADLLWTHWPARLPRVPVAIITLPWAQNGAGWGALEDIAIAMPEAFLNADAKWAPATVVEHCLDEGFRAAIPLFGVGVWADALRAVAAAEYLEQWPGPFGLYLGDRVERWADWARR